MPQKIILSIFRKITWIFLISASLTATSISLLGIFSNFNLHTLFAICLSSIGIAIAFFSYFLDTEDGLEPVNMTLCLSGAVLIATLVTGFGLGLIEVYKWLPVETSIKTTAFTGVFALILGGACFNFRKKYRASWGATEVAAGFLIVIHRTMNNPTALNQPDIEYMIAVLTAGIYLMVRGFDNIDQGLSTKHSQKSDNVKSR